MTVAPFHLSLEGSLNSGIEADVVRYDEAGDPIYQKEKPRFAKFDEAVAELISLKPGKFAEVTTQNVHQFKSRRETIIAAEERTQKQLVDGISATDELSTTKELSAEEMGKMRAEVSFKLEEAWRQMMKASEIIRSLIPGEAHPYVPPEHAAQWTTIPPNALTIIPSRSTRPPPKDILTALDEKKMILARNRKGLTDAREVLIARAGEMRNRMQGENGYWNDVKRLARFESSPATDQETLKKRVWSLRPRWRHDSGVPPEEQQATDVMIPFAADEAAPAFRAAAIATLAPPSTDAERGSSSRVVIPLRKRQRLRVCIRTAAGEGKKEEYSRLPVHTQDGIDEDADLAIATEETFENEIFNEIRIEAKSDPTLNARISMDSVVISAVPEQEMVFELIDMEDEDGVSSKAEPGHSVRADLILSIIKLSMIKLYRARKEKATAPPPPPATNVRTGLPRAGSVPPNNPATQPAVQVAQNNTLLGNLVPYLHYQAFLQSLLRTLDNFDSIMKLFGLSMSVRRKDNGQIGGLDWVGLTGVGDGFRDGSLDVTLEDRQIVSISVSPDAHFALTFPSNTLISHDIPQIPSFLSYEMRKCLLDIIEERLHERFIRVQQNYTEGVLRTVKTLFNIQLGTNVENTTVHGLVRRIAGETGLQGQIVEHNMTEKVTYNPAEHGSLLDWVLRMSE